MVKLDRKEWKTLYFHKINKFMSEFDKCMIIGVDNVQSKQMQQVRATLRDQAELLMGKNTLIRRALRDMISPSEQKEDKRWYEGEPRPEFAELLPHIKGNIGFCFTNMDLKTCRDIITSAKVQAPAKAGVVAPLDVFVEEGPTGMDAQKTSFFQALNLPTKIARGIISMVNRVKLINAGEKVGLSEAKLLNMLGVSPFFYGITCDMIFDNGSCYPPDVLDIDPATLFAKVFDGLANIAAVSLQIKYPTVASVPHSIMNGFKNVISVALATNITFAEAEKAKLFLEDPEAFAAATGGGGGGDVAAAPVDAAPAQAAAAAAPDPEPESDEDLGEMELFD